MGFQRLVFLPINDLDRCLRSALEGRPRSLRFGIVCALSILTLWKAYFLNQLWQQHSMASYSFLFSSNSMEVHQRNQARENSRT